MLQRISFALLVMLMITSCGAFPTETTSTPVPDQTSTSTVTAVPNEVDATETPGIPVEFSIEVQPFPEPRTFIYRYNDVISNSIGWMVLKIVENDTDVVVIAPANYKIKVPGVSKENPLEYSQVNEVEDPEIAVRWAQEKYPDAQFYWAGVTGDFDGVESGLPVDWKYFSTPVGAWNHETAHDWAPDPIQVFSLINDGKEVFYTSASQVAFLQTTCKPVEELSEAVPEWIRLNQRYTLQFVIEPDSKLSLDEICPAGIYSSWGWLYEVSDGDLIARSFHIERLNSALLEKLYSPVNMEGNRSEHKLIDIYLEGMTNFGRFLVSDGRHVSGYEVPLAVWVE